jgi:uncharacterized metal-binding protein
MPSGKVHDRIAVVTSVAAAPAWWILTPHQNPLAFAVTVAAYLFSGFYLSDDLDTNSLAYKRWGWLRFLWWPYRKLVPHRSWISHGIGVGPLLRVVYFGVALWATARGILWLLVRAGIPVNRDAVLGGLWHHGLAWTLAHPDIALWIATGLVLGGLAHSLADTIVTTFKRLW